MKLYMNSAIIYVLIAMLGGVFYREFTKYHDFTGKTISQCSAYTLFLASHGLPYLTAITRKELCIYTAKTKKALISFHIGLNLTAVMLVVRGITQVLGSNR